MDGRWQSPGILWQGCGNMGRDVILAEWTYRIDYVTKGTADAQFLSVLLHPNYSKRVC